MWVQVGVRTKEECLCDDQVNNVADEITCNLTVL